MYEDRRNVATASSSLFTLFKLREQKTIILTLKICVGLFHRKLTQEKRNWSF